MTRDRGYPFAVAAFVAAAAAVAIVAFAPLGTTVVGESVSPADQTESSTPTEPTEERRSTSIGQQEGWGVIARLAIPVLPVAGAPLVAPIGRRGRILRFASTVLLFAGVVVGLLSVGIFLLPAAVLMLVAALRASDQLVLA